MLRKVRTVLSSTQITHWAVIIVYMNCFLKNEEHDTSTISLSLTFFSPFLYSFWWVVISSYVYIASTCIYHLCQLEWRMYLISCTPQGSWTPCAGQHDRFIGHLVPRLLPIPSDSHWCFGTIFVASYLHTGKSVCHHDLIYIFICDNMCGEVWLIRTLIPSLFCIIWLNYIHIRK